MTELPIVWIALRLAALVAISIGLASFDPSKSNLDWTGCLLIPLVTGGALFLWLFAKRDTIDWSLPISFDKPFFPMTMYPVRYWVVAAESLIVGGAVAVVKALLFTRQSMAFGATFLCTGIAIVLAVRLSRVGMQEKQTQVH